MAQNTEHHFVPQFYLRNFACLESPKQINLFNFKVNKFIKGAAIRSQAKKSRMYGSVENEHALGNLETVASTIIRNIINKLEIPKSYGPDHLTLMAFIALQSARTPTAILAYEQLIEQQLRAVARLDEAIASGYDQLINYFREDSAVTMIKFAVTSFPLLTDLVSKLFINTTTEPFITSDHPVVLYNQYMERRKKFGGTGFGSSGLQIFFPLSSQCCLACFDRNIYRVGGRSTKSVQIIITKEDVRSLNWLQVTNADTQLFFNSAVNESDVRHIVSQSLAWRCEQRSRVDQFSRKGEPEDRGSRLLVGSRVDPRIKLNLSEIKELQSVKQRGLGRGLIHIRNVELSETVNQFKELVRSGKYEPNEFYRFLSDSKLRV